MLPATLRHRVLRLAHYHVLAVHPGQTRLHNRLRRVYYWPQMAADCATTVRECNSCAKNRVRLMKQANPMKLFPATRPLETVAIDILGPLPKSKSGHRFILVITDRFTKLTQVIPLKRIKAYDVAVALVDEWIFKYDPPKVLVLDQTTALNLCPSSSRASARSWASRTHSRLRITRRRTAKRSDSIAL